MSFLNAVTDVFRPRSAAGELETGPRVMGAEQEPSTQEKQAMLHLSNVSHAVNHDSSRDSGVTGSVGLSLPAFLGAGYGVPHGQRWIRDRADATERDVHCRDLRSVFYEG